MRKITLVLIAFVLVFEGCKKSVTPASESDVAPQAITQRNCGAYEVLQEQLKADPGLRARMEQIELFTEQAMRNGTAGRLVGDTIEIPVVVHVLYHTAAQNISDDQINSQIEALNE